ncbi:MAG: hypothetical protein ISR95_04430 [Candidatus Marinimicrobia bacterium]|nr:hypothetical protein [Candidatus Neomarinimicrobiota bacterium]
MCFKLTEVPPKYQVNFSAICHEPQFLLGIGMILPGFRLKIAEIPSPNA